MELTATERLVLANTLPRDAGSLKESLRIKRLRDRISLTEEEQEEIDMDGRGSYDPQKLNNLEDKEIELDEDDREIIALAFIKKEDEDNVPTGDTFVELYLEFQEDIESHKEDLGDDE